MSRFREVKRVKRMTRIIACAVLVVGLLAGLPGPGAAASYDLKGKTVTFVGWWDYLDKFAPGKEREGRIQEAEKKFNCKIVAKPLNWDDYTSLLMTRLLSGDSEYVWLMNHNFFWQLAARDAFCPLDKVLPQSYYKSLPKARQGAVKVMSHGGNTYGFGSYGNILGCLRFMAYNKTMFEREGFPDAQKLYEQGKWDWDHCLDIANKATKDLDGDGNPDQWGLSSLWHWGVALSNDGKLTRADSKGRPIFTGDEINVTEGMAMYLDLYEKYKVCLDDDWGGDQFVAGKVAMQPLEFWRFEFIGPKMKDRWGIVPVPKGPRAADYRYPNLQLESLVLPANSKDPKAFVALADFLFTAEDHDNDISGSIKAGCPDRVSAEIVKRGVENWKGEMYDLNLGAVAGQVWSDALMAWLNGEKSAAVAMKEVKPAIQTAINDFFAPKKK